MNIFLRFEETGKVLWASRHVGLAQCVLKSMPSVGFKIFYMLGPSVGELLLVVTV